MAFGRLRGQRGRQGVLKYRCRDQGGADDRCKPPPTTKHQARREQRRPEANSEHADPITFAKQPERRQRDAKDEKAGNPERYDKPEQSAISFLMERCAAVIFPLQRESSPIRRKKPQTSHVLFGKPVSTFPGHALRA
jgi:hypothetical protein